ncbi:MAG TPA: hypothetical protein VIL30_15700 [Ramlibacter sp.]|jgi:hypothetical protein
MSWISAAPPSSSSVTVVEAVVGSADGSLLAVLRDAAEQPVDPQRLVDVSTDGTVGNQRVLIDVPPDASWFAAKLAPDGRSILASIRDQPALLLDRLSGKRLVSYLGANGLRGLGFAENGDVLLSDGLGSFDRPLPQPALRFGLDGVRKGEATAKETVPIFTDGIAAALTPDGKLMVQHEETLNETGVVALRVIEPEFASWAGSLMLAPVSGWMDQILPRLWVSPDSKFVAASFDSSDQWGKINSALIVWELETKQLVNLTPTWRAIWGNVVWLPNGRLAASRYNIDWHDSEVAIIAYNRSIAGQ